MQQALTVINNNKQKANSLFVSDNAVETGKIQYFQILKLTGRQFEKIVAQILTLNGYEKVSLIGQSGDQGLDLIANLNGKKIGFQCKRWTKNIGNRPVQEAFAGKAFYNCDEVVVVASGDFTKGAKQIAEKTGVKLWNKDVVKEYWEKAVSLSRNVE